MSDLTLDGEMPERIEGRPQRGAAIGTTRWQRVVGGLGLLVVLWVGSELYDVVSYTSGPAGGGPGVGHTPTPGKQDTPAPSQPAHTPPSH